MLVEVEKPFCKICALQFSKESTLNLHSKIVHQNTGTKQKLLLVLVDQQETWKFSCEVCASIFAMSSTLSRHMVSVHGKNKRHC